MLHEESVFALFEMTPDLVCIVNREGYFLKINPAVSTTLGYPEEELMAVPVSSFIHPDDKERTAANRRQLLEGKPLLNFQNRYLTKQGETVWLEWTSVYLPEKETVFAIAKNITAGKLAEMEQRDQLNRLYQLNTEVKQHSEKERQQIAGALHEDVAQLAAAIQTKIEWLTTEQQLSAQSNQLVQQTLHSPSQLLNKVRSISYSLSTDTLAVHGLNESLRDLCGELTARTGIECTFNSNVMKDQLTTEEKLDVYRVCQEALQNAGKHAGASGVSVSFLQTKKGALLTIKDDGAGFDLEKETFSGISVMKARALSIGAVLTIDSDTNGTLFNCSLRRTKQKPE